MMRLGIAGIGSIAESYMNLLAAGRIDARLTAVSSRNTARAHAAVARCGFEGVSVYESYEALLASGEIDALIICTPHPLHPKMAMQALAHGIHTLVEKPVGVYGDEVAALLVRAAQTPAVCAGVLYCKRMSEPYRFVKKLVEEGRIGQLSRANWLVTNLYRTAAYHRSSAWRGTYRDEGGGVLMNQASHQLDMLLWLCPPPRKVYARCYEGVGREIEVENDATLQIEFDDGAVAQFTASSREFPGTNRLELSGSLGQIIVENDCQVTCNYLATDERTFSATSTELFATIPFTQETHTFAPADNETLQTATINDFLHAAQAGAQPVCSIAAAAQSLAMINAAYLSSWSGAGISFPPDHAAFRRALEARCTNA